MASAARIPRRSLMHLESFQHLFVGEDGAGDALPRLGQRVPVHPLTTNQIALTRTLES